MSSPDPELTRGQSEEQFLLLSSSQPARARDQDRVRMQPPPAARGEKEGLSRQQENGFSGTATARDEQLGRSAPETQDPPAAGGRDSQSSHFCVYKRRWFGLLQLVLLNIIVSWDVRLRPPVLASLWIFFRRSSVDLSTRG